MLRNIQFKSNRKKTAIGMASFYLFSLALFLVLTGVAASEEHGNDQAKKNITANFSICDGDLKTVKRRLWRECYTMHANRAYCEPLVH